MSNLRMREESFAPRDCPGPQLDLSGVLATMQTEIEIRIHRSVMAIPTFLGVYVGAEPIANLVNVIPAVVTNGFNAAASLLPAVGMALLLRMLWNNKIAIYFLLGFVLFEYLGMPMIAVAAVGAVIVVVTALRDLEMLDLKSKVRDLRESGVSAGTFSQQEIEEEDFFAW